MKRMFLLTALCAGCGAREVNTVSPEEVFRLKTECKKLALDYAAKNKISLPAEYSVKEYHKLTWHYSLGDKVCYLRDLDNLDRNPNGKEFGDKYPHIEALYDAQENTEEPIRRYDSRSDPVETWAYIAKKMDRY